MPPVIAHKECHTPADAIAARDAVLARRKAFFAPARAPKPVAVADPKWISAPPVIAPVAPVEPIKFPSLHGAFKVQFYIGPEYQIEISLDFERPKIREIQNVVCKVFDIKRMDLLSQRRTRSVVFPRQVAMYLAKTLTPCSLPEIGRCFGGRDHTTVLHAVKKIDLLIQTDAPLARQVGLVRAALFLDGRGK